MTSASRLVTSVQFSDGTTIDGDRIDTAMAAVRRRFNALPPEDLQRRMVQTQFVGGFMPQDPGTASSSLPWMRVFNSDQPADVVGNVPAEGVQNQWRHKAARAEGIRPEDSLGSGTQYALSNALHFSSPSVVVGLTVFLTTDNLFLNDWLISGSSLEDFAAQIYIDDPYQGAERHLANLLVTRAKFRLLGELWTELSAGTGILDFVPNFPTALASPSGSKLPEGVALNMQNLYLPIPAGANLRVELIIPEHGNSSYGWEKNSHEAWQNQYYSWALTVLEEPWHG